MVINANRSLNLAQKACLNCSTCLAGLFLVYIRIVTNSQVNSPIVETVQGKIQGLSRDGVLSFRGIPYAKPPINDLRFCEPQDMDSWSEVLECTSPGPIAPQNVFELEKILGAAEFPQNEDCLTLNVWTPSLDGKFPVMVWIHGGAFATGTGRTPWYDGTKLADKQHVVIVTINYRLGALGFCYLGEFDGGRFPTSGINGIFDQVKSLEWVRDNISNFGGDPSNVTIFGESAGAMSVGTLLGLPKAKGLFKRAILESGACSHCAPPQKASQITTELLKTLGIGTSRVEELARVPIDKLIEAQGIVTEIRGAYLSFQPVIDGTYLPKSPLESVREGFASNVELIVGTNEEEMKLFGIDDPELQNVDEDKMILQMTTLGGQNFDYQESRDLISAYKSHYPKLDLGGLWFQMLTDYVFRMPANRLVEAQSNFANCYYYLFRWASPSFGGIIGSSHSLEIPFVFDNLDKRGVDLFTGGDIAQGRESLAKAMSQSWTSFAKTSIPTSSEFDQWPVFNSEDRATMVFDINHRVEYDIAPHIRKMWDEVDFRCI